MFNPNVLSMTSLKSGSWKKAVKFSNPDHSLSKIASMMAANGYTVDCDSKYFAVYKGKGVKVTFKFTDSAAFTVIVTKIRKKYSEKDIMFNTEFPESGFDSLKTKLETAIESIKNKLVA